MDLIKRLDRHKYEIRVTFIVHQLTKSDPIKYPFRPIYLKKLLLNRQL